MSPNSGMSGFLTIHRCGHQWFRGERFGGLSAAKFHVFSAHVFLDIAQEAFMHHIIGFLGQNLGLGRE